jgi:hypothetical protein
MTLATAATPEVVMGVQHPRSAPPLPAKTRIDELRKIAKEIGIAFIPAQDLVCRYLTAVGPDGWLYREVADIMSRRNGKTEILVPKIVMDLRDGRKILHTAQNRTLPRRVFMRVAHVLKPKEVEFIRYANGMEQIVMRNGGEYLIVAPKRGARGLGADTLIFDELREFEDFDIIAAASPTLTASQDPQTIYLSNAGSDMSVVLNDLKRRGESGTENGLAYLEWSASAERSIDDRQGWAEANPALGHFLNMSSLETAYATLPAATFETEHLCRWVVSMQPRLVVESQWHNCHSTLEEPSRPVMAINMSPTGKRASAVMAWQQTDGTIAVVEMYDVPGDPIDSARLAKDLKQAASKAGIRTVAYASWTDAELARNLVNAKPIDGKEFANASEHFARLVGQGRLRWETAPHITDDLSWTARKPLDSGAWVAVPSSDRPVTAVQAAIRAVWLASAPKITPRVL